MYSFRMQSTQKGEVIYQTAGKSIPMSTSSLLRNSLSISGRHHHQRASGMTSSSSATSSNSNNLNSERHRDGSRDLQKMSPQTDDGRDMGRPNRLHLNNGMYCYLHSLAFMVFFSKFFIGRVVHAEDRECSVDRRIYDCVNFNQSIIFRQQSRSTQLMLASLLYNRYCQAIFLCYLDGGSKQWAVCHMSPLREEKKIIIAFLGNIYSILPRKWGMSLNGVPPHFRNVIQCGCASVCTIILLEKSQNCY